MAVIKTPFINNNATSSLQDFDKAVEVVSTYLSGDQSKFWSDRMATVAAGLVKPSRQQFDALKLMFDKKVPDAPKEINLHEQKQVEVIFKGFLQENPMNFGVALEEASLNSKRELEITNSIDVS